MAELAAPLDRIRRGSMALRSHPAVLSAGVTAVLGALVIAGLLVARDQVAQHARDHFREDAVMSAEQIADEVEMQLTGLRAVAAFMANVPTARTNQFRQFAIDLNRQGLIALSAELIGFVDSRGSAVDLQLSDTGSRVSLDQIHFSTVGSPLEARIVASAPFRIPEGTAVAFSYPVFEANTGVPLGHVYTVQRVDELVESAGAKLSLGHNISEQIDVRISDSGQPIASIVAMADKVKEGTEPDRDLTEMASAEVGGRVWSFTLQADNNYALTEGDRSIQPIIASGGALASIGIGVAVYAVASRTRRFRIEREELVAMISHDLRSPLTSVRTNLELLQDGSAGEMTAVQGRLVDSSVRSSMRLQRLITDLLDQSLLEKGVLRVKAGPVDVAECVNAALDTVVPQLEAQNITWRADLRDGLPQVQGDADRYVQVLSNLLSNAARYTPARGGVAVEARARDGWVDVIVSDTGPGISEEHQERIFEPYYSVEADSARASGSAGLGLAVAKGLVDLQDGEIAVQSNPGAGATFIVSMQIWKGDA